MLGAIRDKKTYYVKWDNKPTQGKRTLYNSTPVACGWSSTPRGQDTMVRRGFVAISHREYVEIETHIHQVSGNRPAFETGDGYGIYKP